MKTKSTILYVFSILLSIESVLAHPGSGIVIDREGNIFFVDTGSGVWKIDRMGTLTKLAAPAYHWMAIDSERRLANVKLPSFSRGGATVSRDGSNPSILVSSDFPITVGQDGSLYYPWTGSNDQLQIFRLAPSGSTTVVLTFPAKSGNTSLRWLNGIKAGLDGSIYFTENSAVRKIMPKGGIVTILENPTFSDCNLVPGINADLRPYFRDLDIDSVGNVYVAATGCGAVLKITTDKTVSTVLTTAGPWSPTAVAISGSELFVLEYLHTLNDDRREWMPRVRKVTANGDVVTLAAIER